MRKLDKIMTFSVVGGFILIIGIMILTGYFNTTNTSKPNTDEVVFNSSPDGFVYQVDLYLKKTLKDPDSYQSIEWSKVVKNSDGTFSVRHKYRAKNSFGGYGVEEKVFKLSSSGDIISATKY
jgi:hypothetical protein